MQQHLIASREDWLEACKTLLVREKEATRLRDSINAERMALPWVPTMDFVRRDDEYEDAPRLGPCCAGSAAT